MAASQLFFTQVLCFPLLFLVNLFMLIHEILHFLHELYSLSIDYLTILLVHRLLILTSATLVFDGEELKFSTAKPVGV